MNDDATASQTNLPETQGEKESTNDSSDVDTARALLHNFGDGDLSKSLIWAKHRLPCKPPAEGYYWLTYSVTGGCYTVAFHVHYAENGPVFLPLTLYQHEDVESGPIGLITPYCDHAEYVDSWNSAHFTGHTQHLFTYGHEDRLFRHLERLFFELTKDRKEQSSWEI